MGVPMDDQTRAQQKYYFASKGGGNWGKKKKTGTARGGGSAKADEAQDIREMMRNWTTIETAAKKQFPNATVAELRKITGDAMMQSLRRQKRR